ncbi:MAG: hypothetical protein NTZ45_02310 [Methylococcales bacterium]|nr:hypothetical protein [Methylococcales bacterium]
MPVITLNLEGRRPSSGYLLYDKAGSRLTFSLNKKGKHHAAKYERKQQKIRDARDERESSADFQQFVAWSKAHEAEFIHPLTVIEPYVMTIAGVNPAIRVEYGLELVVCIRWKDYYDEFTFAGVSINKTSHGYENGYIMEEWRNTYFNKKTLIEQELYKPIRDYLNRNEKFHRAKWVALYKDDDFCAATLVEALDPKAHEHIPVWLKDMNIEDIKNDH